MIQTLKRIKLALFVQIAWIIWTELMSYKPLSLNGLSISNYAIWVFCLLMIALMNMKQSAKNSAKVRNDSLFWWLNCLTLYSASVG